jgi:hypothetical protein
MKKIAVWFARSLWLGVLIDWVLGIPAIFAPEWTLRLLREQPAPSPTWVAFTSLLLVLLSFFYLPIASEPYRFPAIARLAVASRLLQAIFFLWLYPQTYAVRGFVNLGLFVVQTPLLLLTRRETPRPGFPEEREPNPVTTNDLYEYDGSTFAEVKEVVFRNPCTQLPQYPALGLANLMQLFNASARNLTDKRDIRPYFDKLIHAHGICCAGVWEIDNDSAYTGYFAKGSRGLVLARLSVAGPRLKRGQRRALGIAGKVFPTMDPNERVKPGNFVTVSHLSGSRAKYILDIEMINAPTIGFDPAVNFVNRIIFRLMDTRPGYRQLHPLSTLGVPRDGKVVTPDLMLLAVAEGTPRVNAEDFRDELRLKNYPDDRLIYTINVKNFADERWTRLGTITFTEDVVSEGGDKRLHFWIPADVPSRN